MTVPEAGETDNHCDPPEVVDVETEKFKEPEPLLITVTDCVCGSPASSMDWKRRPDCEICNCACPLLTVASTPTLNCWLAGDTEIEIVPVLVPSANPLGFILTDREMLEYGATVPELGDTDNQFPPDSGIAVTVNVCAEFPLLVITMDCVTADVEPCVAEKLSALGLTPIAGPEFPVTVRVNCSMPLWPVPV